MAMPQTRPNFKPDIAKTKSIIHSTLERVGMAEVELPVLLDDHKGGLATIPAKAGIYVSLDDPHAKGIHMSRLYLKAKEYLSAYPLSFPVLASLTEALVETHKELSFGSHVDISFDYIMHKPALKSEESGYRFYPVNLVVSRSAESKLSYEMKLDLVYSSTCPCSAALARQIVQESFLEKFALQENISKGDIAKWIESEESQIAVPHAQRSKLDLTLRFSDVSAKLNLDYWINTIEDALNTPVQAAVKREDEQEFARLSGANMMFSEDAARILKACLESEDHVSDYRIQVEHLESLHAHNAVTIATKGLAHGLKA